ncbi:hypothetical protein COEREDRAFT_45389 [Coemansia reversa NRRL 1564]|uniref:Uncharacterized protein n=1 Tax=Coemansia reversa (strain ATCC 12441 / NRRL 1564) TaxID=763665 RepID=A0A2G5B829_COERN|nr:hypothetical protein COEREDRAFT_45389 [Coemansia reversa NRRL 1564]|eukprot:PIA15193.1 hypothetical protein COEREDRAFT_45389 [Coemansia reversa NRRL 1564]
MEITLNQVDSYRRWHRTWQLHKLDVRRIGVSRILNSGSLVLIRSVLFSYTLGVWIFAIVFDIQHGEMSGHFAYFTHLCYTGLLAYLGASLIHTVGFWRCGGEPSSFTGMARTLQLLHWLLFESALVYATVVTTMFWGLIYKAQIYDTAEHRWLNASVHATNAVCIFVDAAVGGMVFSAHWTHPLVLAVVMVLYLVLAFLNKAINGWFVYDFIDYEKHGWVVMGTALGIAAGIVVVYYALYGILMLLDRMLPPRFTTELLLSDDNDEHNIKDKEPNTIDTVLNVHSV